MGVKNLLPFLKDAQEEIHIKKYKGKVLGIDAYGWLHRGAYSCAQQLALGQDTKGYVNFAMKRIALLRYYEITPYVVFDGGFLPAKAGTESERAQRREENLKMAKLHYNHGRAKEAREYFVKCVDVTHAMAYEFIKVLREAKIEYIVAPYEADAQLAYLENTKTIDGIITEDSDLLVFGCKTVLYKLNDQGHCIEMLYENRSRCEGLQPSIFSDDSFRQMAILSGCDYLDSVPGMGLKTAHKYLRRGGSVSKALTMARWDGLNVPLNYQKEFEKAEKTFAYQRVFDRCKKTRKTTMVTLKKCEELEAIENEECIGPLLPKDQIEAISRGDMDPITKIMMRDAQHSISRSASAPSSMKSAKSKAGPSRQGSTAGQRSLDAFLQRKPAEDKSSTTRSPLLPTQSKAELLYSNTNLGEVKQSSEYSKYFSQKSPVIDKTIERETVILAHFTPTQKQGTFQRCASTDSGEISSPVSSARKTRQLQGQHSSPIADDQSSPTTSPLSFRTRKKSDKNVNLAQQYKSPVVENTDSDIEEEEEEEGENNAESATTTTISFFEQFAFQQDTPTNDRIIGGGWTREKIEGNESKWIDNRSTSRSSSRSISGGKRSSVAAFLQFKHDEEEDDATFEIDTPAYKRKYTESDRSKMDNLKLPMMKRSNTFAR